MSDDYPAGIIRAFSLEEHQAVANDLWEVGFEQLARGTLSSKTVYLATPRLIAYREQWNRPLRIRGALSRGHLAFALPTRHGLPLHLAGRVARPRRIPWLADSRQLDAVTEASYANVLLVFDAQFLRRIATAVQHPMADTGYPAANLSMLPARPDKALALRQEIERLLAGVEQRSAGRTTGKVRSSRLDEHLAAALLDALVVDDVPQTLGTEAGSFTQRVRTAAECIEYARFRDYDVTIPELCALIGKSRRTLEYVFRETTGTSPARFLQLCRLRRVHRDLGAGWPQEISVTEIATRWGFFELGRFSGAYRRLFGEVPSQTLQRSPARKVGLPALAVSPRAEVSARTAPRST